jgi:glucose/arabinose dehydrogenase
VRFGRRFLLFAVGCAAICGLAFATEGSEAGRKFLTGQAAMGDWTGDAPGVRRKLTVADLPSPSASLSASNFPTIVSRPRDAQLHVPDGFRIEEYAAGLRDPRVLLTAPNGDIFVTESRANQIKVMRDKDGDGKQDPRHNGKHPELADKVIVPDVLVQAHSATLNLCFYDGQQFPEEYRGDIFAAFHGSWNRSRRTGYKIVRVPMDGGKAHGEYEDFVTGFVTREGNVLGTTGWCDGGEGWKPALQRGWPR